MMFGLGLMLGLVVGFLWGVYMDHGLMTPAEVAGLLKLTASSLYDHRYLKRLGLRKVKVGGKLRFRASDVEALYVDRLEYIRTWGGRLQDDNGGLKKEGE